MHFLEIKTMNKLSKTKLKFFKASFEEFRETLITKLSKLKNDEIDIDGDDVDAVQGNIISELINRMSKRDIETLKRINLAINKIDDGSFGICEECDEFIGEKRLLAVPGCSVCISCAEEMDRASR